MTESLDPEEVKDILSLVFAKINEIIKSYDGFVEKYIGDAVMAVFGVPKPMRMIRSERFGRPWK
jgi:adenylate cyclase